MKTIQDIFDLAGVVPADAFGVELELEYNNNPVATNDFRMEHDGSLRNQGIEYVMRKPLSLDRARVALAELQEKFEVGNNHPRETNLASTHIHINVRNMTYKEVLDFVALIMTFEVCIAKNSGQDRWQNYFAVGSCESDEMLRILSAVRCERDFYNAVRKLRGNDLRYSGINLISLTKYGTVEVRYLGAKPQPTEVIPWLDFYNELREFAYSGVEWDNLFEAASMGDLTYLEEQLKTPFKINQEDMVRGIRNAQDLVFPTRHDHVSIPRGENGLGKYFDNV